MSITEIDKKQQKETMKFELAKQIRALLDEARKKYGADDWDSDDIENEISEMVFCE